MTNFDRLTAIGQLIGLDFHEVKKSVRVEEWAFVYFVAVPGRRPTFIGKAQVVAVVADIKAARKRANARLIWVKITGRGPDFAEALKVCRQSGGTYDPTTKQWQITYGSYDPCTMTQVMSASVFTRPEQERWETDPSFGFAECC